VSKEILTVILRFNSKLTQQEVSDIFDIFDQKYIGKINFYHILFALIATSQSSKYAKLDSKPVISIHSGIRWTRRAFLCVGFYFTR
jgi:hypothetical protein